MEDQITFRVRLRPFRIPHSHSPLPSDEMSDRHPINGEMSLQPAAQQCQVCLVGGGPIGLEVAYALKMAGIGYQQFEAGQIGHTMTWWAPQTRWFSSNERISICGLPLLTPDQGKATREQYLTYLRTVVQSFDLPINTYEPAVDVERHEDGTFTLTTAARGGHRKTRCEKIILAIGGTDFPRSMNVPGEDLPHVDGYFRDPHAYFGQKVVVVGGKNSAVEAALRCYHAGAKVTLVYRREALPEKSIKYWLMPEISGLMKAGRIRSHLGMEVEKITPTQVHLRGVTCAANGMTFEPTGERQVVEADEVLKLIGYEQDKRLFKRAGVALEGPQERPVYDEQTMETNVPGIYVAGTAIGGTQSSFKVFLENCHGHGRKIVAHLTGKPPEEAQALATNVELQPES